MQGNERILKWQPFWKKRGDFYNLTMANGEDSLVILAPSK